jgi:HD-GYP domain-containing protein (c-di-GMP phosphodiesterase class II)
MKTNPFFNRGPIQDGSYFFGRKAQLQQLGALLQSMQACALVGPPKMGKTSVLLHLRRSSTLRRLGLDPSKYCLIYISFEGRSDCTAQQFYHELLRETYRQAQDKPALSGRSLPLDGSLSYPQLQAGVEELAPSGLRMVYLLDEIELTSLNPNFDLSFFSALRNFASQPNVAFVTSGERPLHELPQAQRQVGSPFADLFTTVWVGCFEQDEARRLVSGLSAKADRPLDEEFDSIWQETGGHPFWVQLVSSGLLEAWGRKGLSEETRRYAHERFHSQAEPHLAHLWKCLKSSERAAVLSLCQERESVQRDDLAYLASCGLVERAGEATPACPGRGQEWGITSKVLSEFAQERLGEKEREAELFLEVSQEDKQPTSKVALPRDKRQIYCVVRALVKALEARDFRRRSHSDGVARLAVRIAQEIGLEPEEIEGVKIAARLHDLGMIAVSDLILRKPGPLTKDERNVVNAHPLVAVHILEALDFPWQVRPAVRGHHERLDGSGYPDGLMGDEIPLSARIIAVAEVVDTMSNEQLYRRPVSMSEVVQELKGGAGSLYDAQVVQALANAVEQGES